MGRVVEPLEPPSRPISSPPPGSMSCHRRVLQWGSGLLTFGFQGFAKFGGLQTFKAFARYPEKLEYPPPSQHCRQTRPKLRFFELQRSSSCPRSAQELNIEVLENSNFQQIIADFRNFKKIWIFRDLSGFFEIKNRFFDYIGAKSQKSIRSIILTESSKVFENHKIIADGSRFLLFSRKSVLLKF